MGFRPMPEAFMSDEQFDARMVANQTINIKEVGVMDFRELFTLFRGGQ